MKYGVNLWVWESPLTTQRVADFAPKVKEMGFDIIEVPLEDNSLFDGSEVRQIISDAGLEATCTAAMGPDRDLIHPDKDIRDNGMAYLKEAIDMCSAMGASNLVGPIYSAVGRTWQQTPDERAADLQLLVGNLSELAAYASDKGVTLGLEPLNRFETSFINTAAQAVEVIDMVGNPALGIMLDTFHMNIEEKDQGDAIRLAGKRVVHIHSCGSDRGAPGNGLVDWSSVAQALTDIGYDGPLVIESFTPKVKTIARAAAIWREFEESPDALASQGLAFLKANVS